MSVEEAAVSELVDRAAGCAGGGEAEIGWGLMNEILTLAESDAGVCSLEARVVGVVACEDCVTVPASAPISAPVRPFDPPSGFSLRISNNFEVRFIVIA